MSRRPLLIAVLLLATVVSSVKGKNGVRSKVPTVNLAEELSPPDHDSVVLRRLQANPNAPSAQNAFAKREGINALYGVVDQQEYGTTTKTILRYTHPDNEPRNLCPYVAGQDDFLFEYTMTNAKIESYSASIEVTYSPQLDFVYNDGVTAEYDPSTLSKLILGKQVAPTLTVKRPQLVAGYFRLGDVAVPSSSTVNEAQVAMLVKGHDGIVMKPPHDYELIWKDVGGYGRLVGSSWKPIPPAGYVCLGHVWQASLDKPATDLIRCLQSRFVASAAAATRLWNNDSPGAAFSADYQSASVWQDVTVSYTALSSGTFISKQSHDGEPALAEFKTLKKACVVGYGTTPFCGVPEDDLHLILDGTKNFSIPYARLKPCDYHQEDKTTYGLEKNDPGSQWEDYAVELHKNAGSGFVGYKHLGISKRLLGKAYCLGTTVFGTSAITNDLFIHEVVGPPGVITVEQATLQKSGTFGRRLSEIIGGDFVFLFPCTGHKEIQDYTATLNDKMVQAWTGGGTDYGMVNSDEYLGEAAAFGDPRWTTPHYCGLQQEPTESGKCREVDTCFFEIRGCRPYDQESCQIDDDCWSEYCSPDDKLCGQKLKLFADSPYPGSVSEKLPRSVPYGIHQDGGGKFIVRGDGDEIKLMGNAWKAFELPTPHVVSKTTVLEFDFKLGVEAEGHAVCLDEDLNEDVEIKGANRCFRLAGSQKAIWSEVWNIQEYIAPYKLAEFSNMNFEGEGDFKHYKVRIGSLADGPGQNMPFISHGTRIHYLSVIQDNDQDPEAGTSVFKNFQIYDETAISKAMMTSSTKKICDRRGQINDLYGTTDQGTYGESTSTIARFQLSGVEQYNLCPYSASNFAIDYDMQNYQYDGTNLSSQNYKRFTVHYAELRPCGFEEEDKSAYTMQNTDSQWKQYAVELYKDASSGFVGYKHVSASERLGQPYCLGTNAFGSNRLTGDVFIHSLVREGNVTADEWAMQQNNTYGGLLSQKIQGDFVFLFPCSNTDEVKDYKATLEGLVTAAQNAGQTNYGLVNVNEDLGEAASFGDPKWSKPHYCGCKEEPTDSGGCFAADLCYYDNNACPADSKCAPDGTSCLCDDGYLSYLHGTKTLFSTAQDDSCLPVSLVDVTGESFIVHVDNTLSYARFNVECTRLDGSTPDQPPVSVYEHDGTSFAAPNGEEFFMHEFKNLLAGYEYKAKLIPVDGNGIMVPNAVSQEQVAVTYCCCDCGSSITGDVTGRPVGLKVYQVRGHVMFNFIDNSRCAEAYAFTRSKVEEEFMDTSNESLKSVFTPNYNYFPRMKCGMTPILPGTSASDDLSSSELIVGAAYRYCVRAVAQFYSALSEHSSHEICNIHFVHWQASMKGLVTTEPSAGSLPIEDVTVSWELMNIDQTIVIASGSFITKKPGTFTISFNELHQSLDRDNEFPVRIRFAKTTVVGSDSIKHEFLCQEGSVDCTDTGTIVYLKHLMFDEPIIAYDMTTVPVRGKVTVWEPDGCPLIEAEVCLMNKHPQIPDTQGACVKTNHNGEYAVTASIGTTVGLEVSYFNHTITRAPRNVVDYDKGFYIYVNKRYERHDFVDKAHALLSVEVAGGLCNEMLGKSSIQVKVNGCNDWEMNLTQDVFHARHNVPAHVVDINVVGMVDDAGKTIYPVQNAFADKSMTKTIDLLEAGNLQEKTEENKAAADPAAAPSGKSVAASEENVEKVRFQYDGKLQMVFNFMGNDLMGNCTSETVTPTGVDRSNADTTTSLHVTPTGSSFVPVVFLQYQLLEGLYCDILEDGMSVRVTNKVGIDNEFNTYAASDLKGKDKMKKRLMLCSDPGGCTFPVQHGINPANGKKTNAKVIPSSNGKPLAFLSGRPNIYGEHRKDLILEALDKDLEVLKKHWAEVVVVGDYVTGPGASFALPTYEPILILRDPPGGLSQASYENVQTTIKVKSSSVEKLQSADTSFGMGVGVEYGTDVCAGLGIESCSDVLDINLGLDTEITEGQTTTVALNEDTFSSEFTTTWSYTTSDDPVLAGRKSDTIIIPNLNVQYHNVENINFPPGQCSVNMTTTVKFSLTDPGNQPTLSFLSVYSIENHQIPDLVDAISYKQREYDELPAGTSDTVKKKTRTQLDTLQDGLKGWKQTMAKYDQTNALADSSALDIAGREWFSKWAALNDTSAKEPTITDHWSNLAPESLTDRAQAFDFQYIKDAGLASTNKDDIKQTNRIQFSGGGNTMEFSMDHESVEELLRLDPSKKNEELHGGSSVGFSLGLALVGVSMEMSIGDGFSYENAASGTVTDESGRETSVSIVLGDEQEDDEFVVDLYIDPTYGTFVFHTVSGCSRAPHEANTKKGEDLKMTLERPSRPVMPDEAIVFDITLANYGETLAVFQSYVDHTTNPGGLRHHMGGVGLEVPIDYTLGPGMEVRTTLEVWKGPKGYIFPPTTFYLVGLWDELGIEAGSLTVWNYQDANGAQWIKFEEPCPTVEWAGSLKRELQFSVIKDLKPVPLTVFNPRKADGSFESLANNSRLEHVYAWYREIGDTEWRKSQLEDQTQIDFANITNIDWKEDNYGYASMPWELGKMLALNDDGTYEAMLETTCKEVPGAPGEFNAFSTEPILVTVDRVEPELYGKSLPIRDVVVPGEEVVMIFTESIRCELPYRFNLQVTVAGLEDLFDKRNLKIDCEQRKLGFQFDPTRINYDLLMGRQMNVTVENVKDLQGNPIPRPIKFTKTFANLNLREVSSTFDFTLNTTSCAPPIDHASIKDTLSTMLGLSDSGRVIIVDAYCVSTDTVAKVKIGPVTGTTTQRRLRMDRGGNQEDEHTALSAFFSLMDLSKTPLEITDADRRKLMSLGSDGLSFNVSNMAITPGDADRERYSLNTKPTHEEEMILAAAEGCGSSSLGQRQHMLRMEQTMKDHLNETEFHIERIAGATDSRIEELDAHVNEMAEDLEQKLEVKFSSTDSHIEDLAEEVHGMDHKLAHIAGVIDHKLEEVLSQVLSEHGRTNAGPAVGSGSTPPAKHAEIEDVAELLLVQIRVEQQSSQRQIMLFVSCLFVCSMIALEFSIKRTR